MSYYGTPPSGGYGSPYGRPPHVNNNLVWAILATVLCCTPLGIVAIVKAAKVDGLLARGDYYGAQAAADSAKNWSIWSAVAVVVFYAVIVAVALATGGFESSTTY
ncbi:MAG: CD225/dispanin family protein [Actinobacteria bacterium]|nr:CD225/dispanin family protein [Actinomycetota bacterium]